MTPNFTKFKVRKKTGRKKAKRSKKQKRRKRRTRKAINRGHKAVAIHWKRLK